MPHFPKLGLILLKWWRMQIWKYKYIRACQRVFVCWADIMSSKPVTFKAHWYVKCVCCVSARHINRTSVSVCLLLIWITAGFWSGAPLLGWGSYTGRTQQNKILFQPLLLLIWPLTSDLWPLTLFLSPLTPDLWTSSSDLWPLCAPPPSSADRGYGTCEIDWAKATYSGVYRSYIICIFIFCFFIPVLIMLFCYVSIINTVKRGNALSAEGDLTDRQRKIERDVTIVSLHCTLLSDIWI